MLALWGLVMPAMASEPAVTLSFTRTGSSAGDVAVAVSGVESATASMTSVSHSLKGLGNAAIICPDVNGNTSPTINMSFSISGLPADFKFNTVGLHIHALNASGAYQMSADGVNRKYNVEVDVNDDEFAFYNDIDIAAGVTDSHKVWDAASESAFNATEPLDITLQITKGSENKGCFFGLESITLSYVDGSVTPDPDPQPDPDPDPIDPTGAKVYTIKWKNNTQSYMTEQADGTIAIGDYATSNKVFWQFIPTGKDNCFYIRNTATGNYIGSCNMTPSSNSRVQMSATPVEYYVHLSASTDGENAGCYWLSSTDCANYNSETSSARCLNKDGASSYIITWTTAVANKGSYWTLTETDDLYEVKPFTSSAQVGAPLATYHIVNPDGKAYDASGAWVDFNVTSRSQQWYFVGSSNADGGYRIVSVVDDAPLNSGTAYTVAGTDGSAPYHFTDPQGHLLDLAGTADFTFVGARSIFALSNRIYKMPCGSTGSVYIRKVSVGDDYKYPMGTYGNKRITYSSASLPTNKYVMQTRDAATVAPGSEQAISVSLNRLPGDYKVYLYFDWDRDGYFEARHELTFTEKELETAFTVPSEAETGQTRMRIRVTDNGMAGPDDETHGEVLDLMLNVAAEAAEAVAPAVKVNDPNRGSATWADGKASATAKGNATFLYWSEGYRIVSVSAETDAPASARPRTLTAFFAPNTQEMDGIDELILSTADQKAEIRYDGVEISVVASSDVQAIVVFATNGSKVAGTKGSTLSTAAIAPGIYIVKAITANGVASAKLKI